VRRTGRGRGVLSMSLQRQIRSHPLAGLKVVEIADDPGGELASLLLAQMGAEVVKLEPPEGASGRRVGPFARAQVGPDTSLNFWFYNSNKRSVVAELETREGMAALKTLLTDADILVSTLQPRALGALGLDLAALSDVYPQLIVLSV